MWMDNVADGFQWAEETSQRNKDFIKIYRKEYDE